MKKTSAVGFLQKAKQFVTLVASAIPNKGGNCDKEQVITDITNMEEETVNNRVPIEIYFVYMG